MFTFQVTEYTYRETSNSEKLHIYLMNHSIDKQLKPAIIFFHGAAFSTNQVTPAQFEHQANYFASLGLVAVCVEYRPSHIEGRYSPIECLKNAKSAIRWIREYSEALSIHPNKIIAAGASAGGYISLCCAMIEQFNHEHDENISCKPNALALFNGGVDSRPLIHLFPELADELAVANPLQRVHFKLPPSLFLHGTADTIIPIESITAFIEKISEQGSECRLESFEGKGHGFFNYGLDGNKPYSTTLKASTQFLKDFQFL